MTRVREHQHLRLSTSPLKYFFPMLLVSSKLERQIPHVVEDPRKYVYVDCHCVPNEGISIVVRDEGLGFSSTELPNPTAAEQLQSMHGRGIYLMKSLMDEVHFERGGTVVHLRKKCARAENR